MASKNFVPTKTENNRVKRPLVKSYSERTTFDFNRSSSSPSTKLMHSSQTLGTATSTKEKRVSRDNSLDLTDISSIGSTTPNQSDIEPEVDDKLISRQLDRMTRQLTTVADKFNLFNQRFEALVRKVEDIDTKVNDLGEVLKERKENEPQPIPKELRRKVRMLYGKLPEDEQWVLEETFTAAINASLTDQFVSDAKVFFKDRYTEDQIKEASRGYFYHLSKENKLANDNPEKLKQKNDEKKRRSRRQRLLESRQKYVKENEKDFWKDVTQEFMSDEEDVQNSSELKLKTPVWRSADLTALIKLLEKRKEDDSVLQGRQVLRKTRVPSTSPMKRQPSKRAPRRHLQEETCAKKIMPDSDNSDEDLPNMN